MTSKLKMIASMPSLLSAAQRTPATAKSRYISALALLGTLCFSSISPALAQSDSTTIDSRLPRLLRERSVLTRRYADASAQRHSLFGNKPSKRTSRRWWTPCRASSTKTSKSWTC
ncbi:hypothetical protein ACFQT0_16450 [Hymenobacter humi]|uniref:Uncharacterized protein n=1 Tax=Hymenobacter humi TaxID=1411620 RepID=A0ABW2U8P4_9BACT